MLALGLRHRRSRPLVLRCVWAVLAGLLAVPAAAEVPTDGAYLFHLKTLPARRELSPYWGMAALRTGVLANVRFFGAYADVPDPAFPAHPSLETRYDRPQDAVSGLVQYLFPSPDGRNLIPNERDNDPIGLIAREQRRHPTSTTGLRKVMALLDASDAYRETLRSPSPAAEAGAAFQAAVRGILAPAVGVREHGSRKKKYQTLSQDFARLMQQALLQESQDKEGHYPPRIVETALLAYAWLVADSQAELQAALPGLFLPQGALPAHDQAGPPAVETKAPILQPGPSPASTPEDDPALTFIIILQRIRTSEPTPTFVSQSTVSWNGHHFPDCGETSLRNFFLAMLWREGDRLDPKLIADLESRLAPEVKDVALGPAQVRFGQLVRFFKNHPGLAAQGTHACREEWAAIVSGVNAGTKDPLPVPYREAGSCNLAGEGVEAMLNLVAHLLPDPVLNAPWPEPGPARSEAIAGKLDRLCALFPREGAGLDWRTDAGKRIARPYVTLTFSRGIPSLFTWDFREGHYDLTSGHPAPQNDPVITTAAETSDDYWVRAISRPRIPRPLDGGDPIHFRRPNERFFYNHVGDEADRIVRGLAGGDGPMDLRALSLLVYRGLPRTIDHYLGLALLYVTQRHSIPIIPGLRDLPQEDRDRLLADSLSQGSPLIVRMLIDHGARVAARDAHGTPMVFLAVRNLGPLSARILNLLAAAGADLQAQDARGRTALHAAVACSNVEGVMWLLGKGLDLFARDSEGKTPMDMAREAASPLFQDLPPSISIYMEFLERALKLENKAGTPVPANPGSSATGLPSD